MKIHDFIERKNNMSFNYVYLGNDFLVMGSDSRETYINGQYNDNRQKTFVNYQQKLCWSFTGLTKIKDIDNIKIINVIMNSEASILDKLNLIQHIMCYETMQFYQEFQKDSIFDLVVALHTGTHIVLYVLEVKNGIPNNNANKMYTQNETVTKDLASGVHTNMKNSISYDKLLLNPVNEVHELINSVINVSSLDDKTVGGSSYIVLMDLNGNIRTYINGIEREF